MRTYRGKYLVLLITCSLALSGCCDDEREKIEALEQHVAELQQVLATANTTINSITEERNTAQRKVTKLEDDLRFVAERFRDQMSQAGLIPSPVHSETEMIDQFRRDLSDWGTAYRRIRIDLEDAREENEAYRSDRWAAAMIEREEHLKAANDSLYRALTYQTERSRLLDRQLESAEQQVTTLNDSLSITSAKLQVAGQRSHRLQVHLAQQQDENERLTKIAGVMKEGICLAEGTRSDLNRWGVMHTVVDRGWGKKDIVQIRFTPDFFGTCTSNQAVDLDLPTTASH